MPWLVGSTVPVAKYSWPPWMSWPPGNGRLCRRDRGCPIRLQAGDHKGAQLVNEPGAFIWSELHTSDMGKSKQFYTDVFGWGWGGADEYAEARSPSGPLPV